MTDAYEDRVSIELIDTGEHKDRVALVLSKVKGLTMPPQQIVSSAPCTVAIDVPRSIAEKLKGYLEKAGAMVMLEGEEAQEEEALFAAAELPVPEEARETAPVEPSEVSEPEEASEFEDALEFGVVQETEEPLEFEQAEELVGPSEEELFGEAEDVTTPEFPAPPELPEGEPEETEIPEEPKGGKFQQLLSRLPWIGQKIGQPGAETLSEAEAEEGTGEKKSPLAFLAKFRKPKLASEEKIQEQPTPPETEMEPAVSGGGLKAKAPDLMTNPVILLIVGVLAGVVIAGAWGWREINKKEQELRDYKADIVRQIEEESAELKDIVQQSSQEAQTLREQKAALEEQIANQEQQIATLNTQLKETQKQPQSIFPSETPAEKAPWETELVTSFREVMARHAQGLERGYDAQKQTGCSQQLLLDGKSTYTYAQVVKTFDAKHTRRYDVRRENSLVTPYAAEFKIPFQQEIRTGESEKACMDATLQQLETPDHHEFGGYYGYWTLEYLYKDGQWVLNPTVTERNRALYESAFQNGSPDFAKFRIDTELFPDLKSQ